MSADWQNELMRELTEYTDGITEGVKRSVDEVGKETVAILKKTSPKRTRGSKRGKYARGWRVKNTSKAAAENVVTVHNATDYQLTHLLENGHVNRDGSFTAARPHIKAAEEQAAKNLEDKIEVVIRG